MSTAAQTRTLPVARPVGDRRLAVLAAAFLGLGLLYVSGFATAPLLHNAAHDLRHATNFPCH